jgi:hypothetical protein
LRIVIPGQSVADYKTSDGDVRILFTGHYSSFCKRSESYQEQHTIREGEETIGESPDIEAQLVRARRPDRF